MTASSPGRPAAVASQDRSPNAHTLVAPAARWERRLQQAVLVLARIGLAYLFFTQLWWKTPPTFGCGPDFAFTTGRHNLRDIGVDRQGDNIVVFFADRNADDEFNWAVQWAQISPQVFA